MSEAGRQPTIRHDRRIAVALSAVPGLGQLYNGQWRKALFFLMGTLLSIGPAVLLITFGERFGRSLLDGGHMALFLLVALLSVMLFLFLFVMGLFLWASAAADARRTAMALRQGKADDAARTWFFHI
ncbi:MAG: hypothetical protein JOZ75_12840 [Candidatus Dormibacteraeota bacterium]|nr:hypothetical protein [Candidatus Dormibacteraeota bacterium]